MNGIFAIEKPSGVTSNQFMMKLQHLFTNSNLFGNEIQRATVERMQQYQKETGRKASRRKLRKVSKVKMGHGGTLDPLASGVLVIGIGTGTKKLANYLSGTVKTYESKALFGVSTTSGDVEGEILAQHSTKHLNKADLDTIPEKFIGLLKQTPPIYAALKMDGKPLHEYARAGIPLPRTIAPRTVSIYDLTIFPQSLTKEHKFPLLKPISEEAKETVSNLNANLLKDSLYFSKEYCDKHDLDSDSPQNLDLVELTAEEQQEIEEKGVEYRAPLLHFKAQVSSGTYIRSLISDIGKAMRSSCYMVQLIRLQQQEWSLEKGNVFQMSDFTDHDEAVWGPVLKTVLDEGANVKISKAISDSAAEFEKNKKEIEETSGKEDITVEAVNVEMATVSDAKVEGCLTTSTKRPFSELDSTSK